MLKIQPDTAWKKYILPDTHKATWMEDSKPISKELPVSKRELLGLILLAHIQNHVHSNNSWIVGYDASAPEPNDGFITDRKLRVDVEHKIIPQMSKQEPLKAILSTYEKYAKKGAAYGENRTLIIHGNITTQGMIRISDLRDKIGPECPFDRVLLMHAVTEIKNGMLIIHVTEHYPCFGIAQVDFNVITGEASIPHYDIK